MRYTVSWTTTISSSADVDTESEQEALDIAREFDCKSVVTREERVTRWDRPESGDGRLT